jgi:hypothetical protein
MTQMIISTNIQTAFNQASASDKEAMAEPTDDFRSFVELPAPELLIDKGLLHFFSL